MTVSSITLLHLKKTVPNSNMISTLYTNGPVATWQMKFNLSKCVTLKCYRSSSPIEIDYFINDHKLENVKHHPYLGITLDQTMSFIPHLNNITSKATRVLNFIKQNLSKCSQYTKSNAYFSLVRPSLEYASSI